jgi:tRNA(Ile)-lysidine synthase
MSLKSRVCRTVERYSLWSRGSRLVVALSGGADSVALTFLLRELATAGEVTIGTLAHFNHRLRATADRDEQFCRDLAARLGLRLQVGSCDVAALAVRERLSLENAARRARYAFLDGVMAEIAADRVAVGHTLDDQAETFVLKLVRGAGLTGLGGIYPVRGRVVRPLLEVSRQELRDYLIGMQEAWVEDETNEDRSNPRNRVRHLVLPELDRAFGAAARGRIAQATALAREDGRFLDELAAARAAELAVVLPDGLELDATALEKEPRPLVRRILLNAMRGIFAGREIGSRHVEAALDVLTGRAAAAEVPAGRWELRGRKLVLVQQEVAARHECLPFSYTLSIPGLALIHEAGCLIEAEPLAWDQVPDDPGLQQGRGNAALVAIAGQRALRVRSRRPGDRISPPGLRSSREALRRAGTARGRKKLQDLFVDARLARVDRGRVPIVVDDATDELVWVPGHTVSADFQAKREGPVILLKLTRLGGKA